MSEKHKIFITRPIPDNGIEMLEQHFKVKVRKKDSPISRDELSGAISQHDAVLTILTDRVDGELLDQNPNLKIVSNFAVGTDNIDINACTERGVKVGNTPEVLTTSTAECVFAHLFGLTKRLIEGDEIMRKGKYKGWGPMYMLGVELKGKTLGIVGAGRIGSEAARMAYKGFGMNIIYTDRGGNKELEQELSAKQVGFDDMLEQADFISIHVPLTRETRHMFSDNEFKKMKNSAFIINTARGPIIDEQALADALENKEIAGAGLDVFEDEPEINPGLKKMDNVTMTPHTGSATWEARSAMAKVAAQNIIGTLIEGEEPVSILNP
ncbi:D-glycerate dehydrogenase [Patescibacteria group bacterium]|nr:D-glycerate dehydrogenase [Patescibacteria group bacterium]MBU1673066.1 D-glycerate dehydrogenase [Patescibacteria group bacterium]MBU1963672.1 D-glycerate dehydrogenase [Patescibacteria group bacterium]